jgi:hypothetical protein
MNDGPFAKRISKLCSLQLGSDGVGWSFGGPIGHINGTHGWISLGYYGNGVQGYFRAYFLETNALR